MEDEATVEIVALEVSDLERCTRLFALNARRNAKFLSSLQKVNQFTAKTVFKSTENSNKIF